MLSIHKLNTTYPDGTKALSDINLNLPTGMVGLLGANGSGKSTLMRTLACLQAPDNGQVLFNGFNIQQEPMRLRKQLGYLPQYFGVYPHQTCLALMHHIAILKGLTRDDAKKQIIALLKLTNLSEHANKKVITFSGGMRQRFGIAQALLGNPNLLIMDEPTAGLDQQERERLHNVLVTLSQTKLILLSTHIVEDIENLCHHVAIIQQGSIIESANVKTLIQPLTGKIWQSPEKPLSNQLQLSASYRFGSPVFRLYSKTKPHSLAEPVAPSLQDRFFLEENKKSGGINVI